MDLVFEVVFSNNDAFENITANEAKVMACAYKQAINTENIFQTIERDKAEYICNEIYNMIGELIVQAKYIVYQNKTSSSNNTASYDIDYTDIIDKYQKLSEYGKEIFQKNIISDYIEMLKECTIYMPDKEYIIYVKKYKEFIQNINIEITEKYLFEHMNAHDYLFYNYEEYAYSKEYFIELLFQVHANTKI